MIASMYDDGANAFQAFLMLGSPVYGGAAGYLLVVTGRLRPGGGMALAVAIVSASIGLMHATELIFTDAVASDGAWVLAMPSGSLAAAALLGAALFQARRGLARRALFAGAGVLFTVGIGPLAVGIGFFYVIAGWAVCFTLAAMDPPLRTSEPRARG